MQDENSVDNPPLFITYYAMNICYIRDSFIEVDKHINSMDEKNNKYIDRNVERIVD